MNNKYFLFTKKILPIRRGSLLMVIISGLIDSFTCKLDAETFEGADINIGQHNGSMSLTSV